MLTEVETEIQIDTVAEVKAEPKHAFTVAEVEV